jgi:hypothetical protein
MKALKSIFSWLGRFLEKARTVRQKNLEAISNL